MLAILALSRDRRLFIGGDRGVSPAVFRHLRSLSGARAESRRLKAGGHGKWG